MRVILTFSVMGQYVIEPNRYIKYIRNKIRVLNEKARTKEREGERKCLNIPKYMIYTNTFFQFIPGFWFFGGNYS